MAGNLSAMIGNLVSALLILLIGLFTGAAAAPAAPQTINLIMIDYEFIPDHLIFQRDVPYRLHMENHGQKTHELTAPTFFAIATINNPDILNHDHTEVLMQPGDTKDLFLTAHVAGTYDLRCADHDWNGMVGGITVE